MDSRIVQLVSTVRDTAGFQIWRGDYSPLSLESLGAWFNGQVDTRFRSQEEINRIADRSKFPVPIPISERTLTDRTLSLTIDIGMYFGQAFVKNHPSVKWEHYLPGRRFADYGQPVLTGFGGVPLNPVRIVQVIAQKVVSNRACENRLREVYDVWEKKLS
jgi:hypothetical protein